jgi:hypothetical protein
LPLTEPSVAVIVVEPAVTLVAIPFVGDELLIVATPVLDELQVTFVVRFCVLLFENVPVAVNCSVLPLLIVGFTGVTAIDDKVPAFTVSIVEPEIEPLVAVIVVEPAPAAAATPLFGEVLLMVATEVLDELQVTEVVRF